MTHNVTQKRATAGENVKQQIWEYERDPKWLSLKRHIKFYQTQRKVVQELRETLTENRALIYMDYCKGFLSTGQPLRDCQFIIIFRDASGKEIIEKHHFVYTCQHGGKQSTVSGGIVGTVSAVWYE